MVTRRRWGEDRVESFAEGLNQGLEKAKCVGPRSLASGLLPFFENVQGKAVVQLHTCRPENRAQGTCCTTLLPDYFPDVFVGDTETDYAGVSVCEDFDRNVLGLIN